MSGRFFYFVTVAISICVSFLIMSGAFGGGELLKLISGANLGFLFGSTVWIVAIIISKKVTP